MAPEVMSVAGGIPKRGLKGQAFFEWRQACHDRNAEIVLRKQKDPSLNFSTLAREYNLSRERIRQILRKAERVAERAKRVAEQCPQM